MKKPTEGERAYLAGLAVHVLQVHAALLAAPQDAEVAKRWRAAMEGYQRQQAHAFGRCRTCGGALEDAPGEVAPGVEPWYVEQQRAAGYCRACAKGAADNAKWPSGVVTH